MQRYNSIASTDPKWQGIHLRYVATSTCMPIDLVICPRACSLFLPLARHAYLHIGLAPHYFSYGLASPQPCGPASISSQMVSYVSVRVINSSPYPIFPPIIVLAQPSFQLATFVIKLNIHLWLKLLYFFEFFLNFVLHTLKYLSTTWILNPIIFNTPSSMSKNL